METLTFVAFAEMCLTSSNFGLLVDQVTIKNSLFVAITNTGVASPTNVLKIVPKLAATMLITTGAAGLDHMLNTVGIKKKL